DHPARTFRDAAVWCRRGALRSGGDATLDPRLSSQARRGKPMRNATQTTSRRDFLATAGIAAASLAATVAATPNTVRAQAGKKWAGKTLHVQFWSGPEGENIIKHVVHPFKAETGAEVGADYGYTSGSIAKLRAQKNDPQIDVFMM